MNQPARIFKILFILLLGSEVLADDELYILKNLESNNLRCIYHSHPGNSVGLAWILQNGTKYTSSSTKLHYIAPPSHTLINEPIKFRIKHWRIVDRFYLKTLPIILDESWNELEQIETQPNTVKEVFLSDQIFGVQLSVLAESDAKFGTIFRHGFGKMARLEITFDPSDEGRGSLIVELCQGYKKNWTTCEVLNKEKIIRKGGLLKKGKEWVHYGVLFDYHWNPNPLSYANRDIYLVIVDSKRGEALFNITNDQLSKSDFGNAFYVTTLTKNGSWKLGKAQHYEIEAHQGWVENYDFDINLTSTLNANPCLNIYYYLRSGFGDAFITTNLGRYHLKPTGEKFSMISVEFDSRSNNQAQKLNFTLPRVNVYKHGYVFKLLNNFTACKTKDVVMYLDLELGKEHTDDSRVACQTISSEEKEKIAELKSTVTDVPYKECGYSWSLFGNECGVSCIPFSGKSTCENLVLCDADKCNCLPGYHIEDNTCRRGPPPTSSDLSPTPASDELYLLKNLDSNKLRCVYHSRQGKSVGLAWILPYAINGSSKPHYMKSSYTRIFQPVLEDNVTYWKVLNPTNCDFLPPFLDDDWNYVRRVETQPGKDREVPLHSVTVIQVSILAESNAKIELSDFIDERLAITFDPSGDHGSLLLEICRLSKKKLKICDTLNKRKVIISGGILKRGKEWVHFTIKVPHFDHGHRFTDSFEIIDAKSGEVLMNISDGFVLLDIERAFISTPTSKGSWRILNVAEVLLEQLQPFTLGEDKRESSFVAHLGSTEKYEMSLKRLKLSLNPHTSACLNIHYYFRSGFGDAFVSTNSTRYQFKPTLGKWRILSIQLEPTLLLPNLIFTLPKVDVNKDGYVFAMQIPFKSCKDKDEIMYLELEQGQTNDSGIACQTISNDRKEQFAVLKSTLTDAPYKECDQSRSLFGNSCTISCTPFSGKSTCENLAMCDADTCKCLPGYHVEDNTCRQGPPTSKDLSPTEGYDINIFDDDLASANQAIQDLKKKLSEISDGSTIWWLLFVLSVISCVSSLYLLALKFRLPQQVPHQYIELRNIIQ